MKEADGIGEATGTFVDVDAPSFEEFKEMNTALKKARYGKTLQRKKK